MIALIYLYHIRAIDRYVYGDDEIDLAFRFVAIALSLVLFGVSLGGCSELGTRAIASSESVYQHRLLHSPDGIGKIYMGREIAKVMGHRQADWLERDSRDESEQPNRLLEAFLIKSLCRFLYIYCKTLQKFTTKT